MKGVYVLLMHIDRPVITKTGSLGRLHFRKGVYAYVGSALNGLEPRISRHLSKRKENVHWHIDYLTSSPYASTECVIMGETSKRVECKVSKTIASNHSLAKYLLLAQATATATHISIGLICQLMSRYKR